MRIRYTCHYGRLTGYARAARDYLLALHDVDDVQLEIAVLGDELASPEPRYQALDSLAVRWDQVVGPADLEIFHAPPRVLMALTAEYIKSLDTAVTPANPPAKRVAILTWETSSFPKEYASMLSWFDAVIVPSQFCAAVIGEMPTAHPRERPWLHVVPHCFDEDFWPTFAGDRDDKPYRFYSIGAWGERKNQVGVLKAYLSEFTSDDNVELMMVSEGAQLDEVRSLVACSGLLADRMPKLYVPHLDEPLSEDELVGLHCDADCFVSATRGEGWGLGMFEAAIVGNQVICPRWGGQMDFLIGFEWFEGVPYQMTPCFGAEIRDRVVDRGGQAIQVSKVVMPPGVDCRQFWAEPDLGALARRMRDAYDNRFTIEGQGSAYELGRAALEARFGYKTVGPLMANLLRGIAWDSSTHSTH